jgi:uncharacterized phage protein (TIGR01671 family)
MRDILFRGKTIGFEDSKWVYGDLITTDPYRIVDLANGIDSYVFKKTVGQWTGLTDKNGFKIFEGDIIKDKWNGLGIIEYSENNGCWLSIPCEDGLYQCFKDGDISESDCSNFNVLISQGEIIGNIHDNPELIESTHSKEE